MISEDIKLINGSDTDYISPSGKVYKLMPNNLFYLKKNRILSNGYEYCGITMSDGKNHSGRIHRLMAEAFIPNPDNLPIVGHKNNIKDDNRIENLYWTTTSENTQKAFDDKLIINDKGYQDSQSHPVIVYDINMNEIEHIGSVSLCAEKYKINKTTISRQCRGITKGKPRCGYYFRYDSDYI